jgi:hypothetical protein
MQAPAADKTTKNFAIYDQFRYGFVWPRSGRVECEDWEPTPECGNGLHALRDGVGDGRLLCWRDDAVWLVLQRPDDDDVIDLDGKVKAPWWDVLFSGTRQDAIEYAETHCGLDPAKCVGGWATSSGDRGHATSSGDFSMATSSGDFSVATSSGHYSRAASIGYCSYAASSGHGGHATSSGDFSRAASNGYRSYAASNGDYSMAASIGMNSAAASVGVGGRVAAGRRGAIAALYRDDKNQVRFATGVVGEGGIKPNTWYLANRDGQLIEDGSVVESNEGKER